MIGRISRFMTRFVSRWLPDPLIFAMLLTLLTFVIALWLTPQTPISMVKMWGDGFWNLLAFGMQMALIIVTGHALASSAPVKSLPVKSPGESPVLIIRCSVPAPTLVFSPGVAASLDQCLCWLQHRATRLSISPG